ncbi:hypothetical protein ACPA54_27175 [Uniformispora flossi]|uniref:hypothetical protein n=1 Tax=Uniformispora flossi TaxID=3390723 RepID=UPI003C30312A
MAREPDSFDVDVPRLLGSGTSNQTWTIPGSDTVQRRPFGVPNALDLRVINDTDARRALREAYPQIYTSAPTPDGEPLGLLAGLPRLDPHEGNPAASEADFDWHIGYLVEELGVLSRNSERAAVAVAPKARETVRILTSLPESEVPLRCSPDAGDSAVLRAFTVRVAEVVTRIVGEPLVREFGLPSPARFARGLPPAPDDRSGPVLAHGDPTVDNFMWSFGEAVLTDWELARPTGRVSAAAHTLAALVTRAPYPVRPARIEQFVDRVDGAREAMSSGVHATYYAYECARAPWVDMLRGLRNEVDPDLVHRNVRRFLGDDAPSRRRVNALIATHADAFALPALPRPAALHIAEPPPRGPHPEEQRGAVVALYDEVLGTAAQVLPPHLYERYRRAFDAIAQTLPPASDSVVEVGRRLREAGMTHVSHQAHPDRDTYRFGKQPAAGRTGRRGSGRDSPSLSTDEHHAHGK